MTESSDEIEINLRELRPRLNEIMKSMAVVDLQSLPQSRKSASNRPRLLSQLQESRTTGLHLRMLHELGYRRWKSHRRLGRKQSAQNMPTNLFSHGKTRTWEDMRVKSALGKEDLLLSGR